LLGFFLPLILASKLPHRFSLTRAIRIPVYPFPFLSPSVSLRIVFLSHFLPQKIISSMLFVFHISTFTGWMAFCPSFLFLFFSQMWVTAHGSHVDLSISIFLFQGSSFTSTKFLHSRPTSQPNKFGLFLRPTLRCSRTHRQSRMLSWHSPL